MTPSEIAAPINHAVEFVAVYVSFYNYGKGWECCALSGPPSINPRDYYKVAIQVPAELVANHYSGIATVMGKVDE